eukprot:TRINITY_DN94126_c0_g1_i1.p1 TRINITY_DN94126_c0_g1~~TRINITY_DN94126_c0_g1_i1.p1  ORF type:complete len:248 (+),score=33.56 TRINITY_DN94126_c0_g1_i1:107-850(+)
MDPGSSYTEYLADWFPWYRKACCCSSESQPAGADISMLADVPLAAAGHGSVGFSAGMFSDFEGATRKVPVASEATLLPAAPIAERLQGRSKLGLGPLWSGVSCRDDPCVSWAGEQRIEEHSITEDLAAERLELRELMRVFVQEMIRGRDLLVMLEGGKTELCKLWLTANLMYLQLEAAGVLHDIPLRQVKEVCTGKMVDSPLTPVKLDDLCCTLVLRNNECVSFRFASIEERNDFSKCVKMLHLALD